MGILTRVLLTNEHVQTERQEEISLISNWCSHQLWVGFWNLSPKFVIFAARPFLTIALYTLIHNVTNNKGGGTFA
jgi:hypothetical protein